MAGLTNLVSLPHQEPISLPDIKTTSGFAQRASKFLEEACASHDENQSESFYNRAVSDISEAIKLIEKGNEPDQPEITMTLCSIIIRKCESLNSRSKSKTSEPNKLIEKCAKQAQALNLHLLKWQILDANVDVDYSKAESLLVEFVKFEHVTYFSRLIDLCQDLIGFSTIQKRLPGSKAPEIDRFIAKCKEIAQHELDSLKIALFDAVNEPNYPKAESIINKFLELTANSRQPSVLVERANVRIGYASIVFDEDSAGQNKFYSSAFSELKEAVQLIDASNGSDEIRVNIDLCPEIIRCCKTFKFYLSAETSEIDALIERCTRLAQALNLNLLRSQIADALEAGNYSKAGSLLDDFVQSPEHIIHLSGLITLCLDLIKSCKDFREEFKDNKDEVAKIEALREKCEATVQVLQKTSKNQNASQESEGVTSDELDSLKTAIEEAIDGNNFSSAKTLAEKFFDLTKDIKIPYYLVVRAGIQIVHASDTLQALGEIRFQTTFFSSAFSDIKQALNLINTANEPDKISKKLYCYAISFELLKDLKPHLQSEAPEIAKLVEEIKTFIIKSTHWRVLLQIAVRTLDNNEHEDALDFFEKVLELIKKVDPPSDLIKVHTEIQSAAILKNKNGSREYLRFCREVLLDLNLAIVQGDLPAPEAEEYQKFLNFLAGSKYGQPLKAECEKGIKALQKLSEKQSAPQVDATRPAANVGPSELLPSQTPISPGTKIPPPPPKPPAKPVAKPSARKESVSSGAGDPPPAAASPAKSTIKWGPFLEELNNMEFSAAFHAKLRLMTQADSFNEITAKDVEKLTSILESKFEGFQSYVSTAYPAQRVEVENKAASQLSTPTSPEGKAEKETSNKEPVEAFLKVYQQLVKPHVEIKDFISKGLDKFCKVIKKYIDVIPKEVPKPKAALKEETAPKEKPETSKDVFLRSALLQKFKHRQAAEEEKEESSEFDDETEIAILPRSITLRSRPSRETQDSASKTEEIATEVIPQSITNSVPPPKAQDSSELNSAAKVNKVALLASSFGSPAPETATPSRVVPKKSSRTPTASPSETIALKPSLDGKAEKATNKTVPTTPKAAATPKSSAIASPERKAEGETNKKPVPTVLKSAAAPQPSAPTDSGEIKAEETTNNKEHVSTTPILEPAPQPSPISSEEKVKVTNEKKPLPTARKTAAAPQPSAPTDSGEIKAEETTNNKEHVSITPILEPAPQPSPISSEEKVKVTNEKKPLPTARKTAAAPKPSAPTDSGEIKAEETANNKEHVSTTPILEPAPQPSPISSEEKVKVTNEKKPLPTARKTAAAPKPSAPTDSGEIKAEETTNKGSSLITPILEATSKPSPTSPQDKDKVTNQKEPVTSARKTTAAAKPSALASSKGKAEDETSKEEPVRTAADVLQPSAAKTSVRMVKVGKETDPSAPVLEAAPKPSASISLERKAEETASNKDSVPTAQKGADAPQSSALTSSEATGKREISKEEPVRQDAPAARSSTTPPPERKVEEATNTPRAITPPSSAPTPSEEKAKETNQEEPVSTPPKPRRPSWTLIASVFAGFVALAGVIWAIVRRQRRPETKL
jgi:hypothetical protein